MATKGEATRENILAMAEQIILQKGFTGTSIEDIINQANITKSGFFYHFSGKNELASSLIERYKKQDDEFFNGLFERAESLSEDPLQQMLIFMKLMAEMMADIPNGHPGCLVASFTYESLQFEEPILQEMRDGMLSWRALFAEHLQKIADHYPMKVETSVEDLADMLTTILEGGIVTSLALKDPNVLVQQLLQYRNHLRMLFSSV